jgi:DNA primase
MALSPQWLDELRGRITLSSLIGRTVKIQKAGREYKACCPFHNEKSPSFTINDEKGFYHCFGCGAHGDAISWMTEQRGLGFMDAVKDLAAEAQMEVPAPDPRAAQRQEARATLHDVMAAAQDWFVAQFDGIEGAAAREYLKNRGISEKTIREFGFGFAPDSRGRLKQALSNHGMDQLIEAGLLIKVDDKDPYDRFRGRLMIPIRDPRGRVIAFGGRILGDGEPKYLNSPDTPLFDKGRTLYNLDRASPASRKTGRIIVVEGYMDVIALAQAGFDDVVAPLGTALTETQIERLWKMVEMPTICFDGDAAGQKAALRAATRVLPMLRPAHSLRFVELPPGQDPDDILQSNGPAAFEYILNSPISLDNYIWRKNIEEMEVEPGPDERAALLDRLETVAKTILHDQISREYNQTFREKFYAKFGFNRKRIHQVSEAIRSAFSANKKDRAYHIHRAVLLGLSRYPRVIKRRFEEIEQLPIEHNELKEMRSHIVVTAVREPNIEQDMIEQIWATETKHPFKARDLATDFAFSFFNKHSDPTKPESDLFLVINAILHDHETEKDLAFSLAKFENDISEDSFENHKRVVRLKRESREKLTESLEQAATGT